MGYWQADDLRRYRFDRKIGRALKKEPRLIEITAQRHRKRIRLLYRQRPDFHIKLSFRLT